MKALIISLESFQKGFVPEEVKEYILANRGNVFIILDESSKIKTNNPCKDSKKSKRTQAILKLNKIGHRCILTGTFMSKTPVNAYDQMNFLKDGFFPESMFAFAERYELRRNLPSVRGARITLPEKDYFVCLLLRILKCFLKQTKHICYFLNSFSIYNSFPHSHPIKIRITVSHE